MTEGFTMRVYCWSFFEFKHFGPGFLVLSIREKRVRGYFGLLSQSSL